jgi:hypothetical protein
LLIEQLRRGFFEVTRVTGFEKARELLAPVLVVKCIGALLFV